MNERIRILRKKLGLSGEKFGRKIGLTRYAISNIEKARYGVTEQTVISICREYRVSEHWLRTGEGDMFLETRLGYIGKLQEENDLSDFDAVLIAKYIALSEDERASVKRFLLSLNDELSEEEKEKVQKEMAPFVEREPTSEETLQKDIDRDIKEYRRQLEIEKNKV